MGKNISVLFVLFSLTSITILEAQNIKWKVDENGKKVFYNIPTKQAKGVYYSKNSENYFDIIKTSCDRHGVDAELVKALIQVESNYNSRAISPKGASGLMQLMPATAVRFGVKQIFDPWENIEGGVKYLKFLIQLFKNDLSLVLAAYNAGEKAVHRYKGIPAYEETQNYVRKVMALYNGETTYSPWMKGDTHPQQYYKYVDDKGVTHFTNQAVSLAKMNKVGVSY